MSIERPDLDGARVSGSGGGEVWLVFHSRRHRIPSQAVYDELFADASAIVAMSNVEQIALGHPLSDHACLTRAGGTLAVYLVTTTSDGEPVKHFVPTWESLVDFGFDEGKVYNVSPLLIDPVAHGRDITSAGDRARFPR